MTFKNWLESLGKKPNEDPGFDWEDEYSGNIAMMEDAWNAALRAAADLLLRDVNNPITVLESTEFRRKHEATNA